MFYWILGIIVVIAVVCAVAVRLWRQRRKKIKPASRTAEVGDSGKYHSVAIACRTRSCEAVQQLKGKRFLSTEAPALPVQGCAADSCQCRYVHFDDRRDDDRRTPFGKYSSIPPLFIDHERRNQSGRRSNDVVDLDEHRISDYF
jgi:hypothetical protein